MRKSPLAAALIVASFAVAGPAPAAPEGPIVTAPTSPTTPQDARRALLGPGRRASWAPTTLMERVVVDALVPVLVDRARRDVSGVDDLGPIARTAAMEVVRWGVAGGEYLVLREASGHERGTGAYVFRVGPLAGPEVILQAPHAYYDENTGRIAVAMMFDPEGPHPRALFVNTLQRYLRGAPVATSRADVCHRPEHLYGHATDRALAAMGAVGVVQLHGFDAAGVPPGTRVIVSEARAAAPTPRLEALGARLAEVFGEGVRVYHRDLERLGGTTNVQARIVAGHPGAWFAHLEMAPEVRLALRKTRALRRSLATALYGRYPAPPPPRSPR